MTPKNCSSLFTTTSEVAATTAALGVNLAVNKATDSTNALKNSFKTMQMFGVIFVSALATLPTIVPKDRKIRIKIINISL